MRAEVLLEVYGSTLDRINKQEFEDEKHEDKTRRVCRKAASQLTSLGKEQDLRRATIELSSEFRPRMVDQFPPTAYSTIKYPAGVIKRALLGRGYMTTIGGKVAFAEFVKPEGESDDLLFKVARTHNGLTGREGIVLKVAPVHEVVNLPFTGEWPLK